MSSREHRPPAHPILSSPGDPYLDYGPALPDRHGITRVQAIARDPETVWAWWEVEGAKKAVLRDIERGVISESAVAGPVGTIFFPAHPERIYVVEVGGVRSNPVRTPRRGPASEIDPDWTPTADELELLRALYGQVPDFRRSGYAGTSPA